MTDFFFFFFFNKPVPMDTVAGIGKLMCLYCNMLFERQKLWVCALGIVRNSGDNGLLQCE